MWANVFLYFMMLTLVVSAVSIHSMIKLDVALTEGDSDRLQAIVEASNAAGTLCWVLYAAASIDVFKGNIYVIGAYPFVVAAVATTHIFVRNNIRQKKISLLDSNDKLPEFIDAPIHFKIVAYIQLVFTSVYGYVKNFVSNYASKAKADIEIEILHKTVIDLRMKLLARDIEIFRAEDKASKFEKLWKEAYLPASIKTSIQDDLKEISSILGQGIHEPADITIPASSVLYDETDYLKPTPPKGYIMYEDGTKPGERNGNQ